MNGNLSELSGSRVVGKKHNTLSWEVTQKYVKTNWLKKKFAGKSKENGGKEPVEGGRGLRKEQCRKRGLEC